MLILYRQLLKDFNFSIGGYSNPEKEVSDFFYKLCKNELVYKNKSISLLMFGFAQLQGKDLTEINLENWETRPLSKFNYFDYLSGYPEILLSLYIYSLNELCEKKRATNIISENFRRDVNLRVLIDKNEKSFLFKENKRLDALEIIVPGCLFHDNALMTDINSFSDENGVLIKNFVKQDDEFDHEYIIETSTQLEFEECYNNLAKKIFKIHPKEFSKNINNYLPNNIIQNKIKQKTLNNPNARLDEILAVAYSASLFCFFFDCSVEYFVSVSNATSEKKYSLGSLAVGVKNGNDLSFDERSMFSIISNHIASNLSAQIVFEYNQGLKLKYQREKFKILFDELGKILDFDEDDVERRKNRSHAVDNVDEYVIKLWKDKISDYTGDVKPFISNPKKYLKYLKPNELTHQGLLLNIYLDISGKNFLTKKSDFYNFIDAESYTGIRFDYVDFLLLEEFVSLLKKKKGESEKNNEINIKLSFENDGKQEIKRCLEISVEFSGNPVFSIKELYSKLKIAHKTTGSDLSKFLLSNYNLLRIHGDLEIKDDDGNSHFLLSKDVKLNCKNKETFFEILKDNIPENPYKKLTFIIHIQHNLKTS